MFLEEIKQYIVILLFYFLGPLLSMRHLKSEADVIKADTECGLQLENQEVTFEKGDKIICFERKMVSQETDWNPGF